VAEPFRLEGREVVTSTSIGISIFPDDASTADDLAKAADAAMYRAKGHGRHTYEFYTAELTTQALRYFSIESDLRHALARDEFTLYYQPQIELPTGRTRGVEALLRWRHPERGIVLPEQFIGIAEDSGLIDAIGDWVLKQACAQARLWREAGLPAVRISINLSGHQLAYDHTLETVRHALEENCFDPTEVLFELEITESVIQSGEKTVNALKQLRSLGISIAIDDFGTGYSSLSNLKHLPIDTLKIDRAFLRDVPHDADNTAIVAAIVSMGHSLGLRVVAEGVETADQLEFLKQHGCDEVQGFLISEAVAPEHIGAFLAHGWQALPGFRQTADSVRTNRT
jgi:EAL domain-containing protein (putative c-di-GMP-specific phosphodiesterase class I)